MSMSTHIVGFKPADAKWKAMKAVWDACQEAKIDVPGDVEDFFDGEEPDEAGVTVSEESLGDAVNEWGSDSASGYEVEIAKLPKDVKVIRFYNSW